MLLSWVIVTVPWLTNAAWHISRPLAVLHASTNSVPKPKHMALDTLVHGFTAISVILKNNCSIYGVLEDATPNLFQQQKERKNQLRNPFTFDTVYIKCFIKCSSYLLDTYHNTLVVCCSIFDSVDIDVYSTLSVHSRYYRCRWLPRILSFYWSLLWLHWREVSALDTSQLREKVMMELDTLVNILTCINYICVRMEKGQI